MRVACFHFPRPLDLAWVAEDALRFSPQIALREPDAVFVEIGKCYRLYREEEFARKAAALFRRMNIPVSLGFGDSIESALLSAKHGGAALSSLSVEALFDLADPLGNDPRAHPLVEKLVVALKSLGVRTLAQFRAVPRRELASRFGPVGLLCRQKLDGELLAPWKPWIPPEVVSESLGYLYADFHPALEPLLFDAKKLLDRIFVRLRFRGLKAVALEIVLFCEKISIQPERERKLRIEFLLPQAQTKGTLSILRDFFAKEFAKSPILAPLEKLTITVAQATPGYQGQRHLYHSREERNEAYAAFVSQLSQSHGKGSAFQAQTVEERLPEHSWEKVSLAGKPAELHGRIPLRPTHLLQPQRIELSRDLLRIRKKLFRVRRWSESVEKISSGWLEAPVERSYFEVEVDDGQLLWVYLGQDGHYYLHGYYG